MAIWKTDPNHSEIGFKVRHLVISSVAGKFTSFEATVDAEKEDFSDAKVEFEADVNSITTGNEQRDGHLKSADFFDAANHPKLKFVSSQVIVKGNGDYKLKGDLTIRGMTQPVELSVDFGGIQRDFDGNTVAGFEVTGKINRLNYGLHWNAVTEAGGIVVSDEVRIQVNAELIRQP